LNCPVCRQPMIVLELDQVEIDYCTTCGGIWLDAGELELLLGDSVEKDGFLASFEADAAGGEKHRRCPICSKKMEKVVCGAEKRVRIDRCRRNDGIWLDEGELEEIVTLSSLGRHNRVLDLLKDMFAKKAQ
jgi:Zn-finger nucleic acid-binding protein